MKLLLCASASLAIASCSEVDTDRVAAEQVLTISGLSGCGETDLYFATQRKMASQFFNGQATYQVTISVNFDKGCTDRKWTEHVKSAGYVESGGGMWENQKAQCLASGVSTKGEAVVICEIQAPVDGIELWRPEQ